MNERKGMKLIICFENYCDLSARRRGFIHRDSRLVPYLLVNPYDGQVLHGRADTI